MIWIIKDVPLKYKYVKLSPFQSAFIHPINRTLVTWDSKKFVLILYSQLQHVGGKNFVAQRKVFNQIMFPILGYLLLIYNVI